jgi:hypothetical protein
VHHRSVKFSNEKGNARPFALLLLAALILVAFHLALIARTARKRESDRSNAKIPQTRLLQPPAMRKSQRPQPAAKPPQLGSASLQSAGDPLRFGTRRPLNSLHIRTAPDSQALLRSMLPPTPSAARRFLVSSSPTAISTADCNRLPSPRNSLSNERPSADYAIAFFNRYLKNIPEPVLEKSNPALAEYKFRLASN